MVSPWSLYCACHARSACQVFWQLYQVYVQKSTRTTWPAPLSAAIVVGSPFNHSCVLRSSYVRTGPIGGSSSEAVTAVTVVGSGVGVDVGIGVLVGVAVGGVSVGVAGSAGAHPDTATAASVAHATSAIMVDGLCMALRQLESRRCCVVAGRLVPHVSTRLRLPYKSVSSRDT